MDGEFLHATIHNLRGPVSRVRILSELLIRRASTPDPESQTLVQYIDTSVSEAEKVIEAIRRYTEVLDLPFQPCLFDLTDALQTALERVQERIASSGATVAHGQLPTVYAGQAQMATLFEELIANSLRFHSDRPPVIEIGAVTDKTRTVFVSVADNGTGLTDSDAERIFRPFARASQSAGLGIGLCICKRIVVMHGGDIRAVPRAGGLEIRFGLPLSGVSCVLDNTEPVGSR